MGVHEGEAFSAITKSIGSAPPAQFVVPLFALVRCRFRLLLIGQALVQYAVTQRPANAGLLKQWKPLAYQGMEQLVELFGRAPPVRCNPELLQSKCGRRTTHS